MADDDKALSPKLIVEEVDAEVKRVSELFQFILKYIQQFEPSGVEFSNLRQYLPSDDASRIDWKSSARTNDLYVKEYEVEKDTDVFILLDASNTMTFGTADKLKSEYAAVMAATLAYASVDNGLKVGIEIRGQDLVRMNPESSINQYQKILREVTKPEYYGGSFNLEDALDDAISRLKANTSVFIISDFIGPGDGWKPKAKLANSKFKHLMSVMVRDLRDYDMASTGNVRFESPDGEQKMVLNSSRIKEAFVQEAAKQEEKIKKDLRGVGSSFLKIDTRDSFAAKFAEYFDQQGERW